VIPLGHIAGMPVEETLAMYAPTLLIALGGAATMLRARVRKARSERPDARDSPGAAAGLSEHER
jgi:hypothetical protein